MRASLKRAAVAASVVGAAADLVATATPAHAVNPAQANGEIIAAAGSDTTEEVMRTYLNTAPAAGDFNIPARPAAAGFPVPADAGPGANCQALTYFTAPVPPPTPPNTLAPNGSNAGINALNASVAAGDSCIDIA